MSRNPSASFEDVYSVQTARIEKLERELAAITATLRQCREALASCRGGVEAIQAADAALRLRPVAEHPSEIERGDGQNHEAE